MSNAQGASGYARDAQGTTGRAADEQAGGYESARYEEASYGQVSYQAGDGEVSGRTALAAWLMILGGTWSFFVGLAIVIRKAYFTSLPGYASTSQHYPYNWNLSGWGWANLILGLLVLAAGACVLLGQTWARVTGIVLAVISAIGTFLFLPYFPLWSILVIALDVFIIWALATASRPQNA